MQLSESAQKYKALYKKLLEVDDLLDGVIIDMIQNQMDDIWWSISSEERIYLSELVSVMQLQADRESRA